MLLAFLFVAFLHMATGLDIEVKPIL